MPERQDDVIAEGQIASPYEVLISGGLKGAEVIGNGQMVRITLDVPGLLEDDISRLEGYQDEVVSLVACRRD